MTYELRFMKTILEGTLKNGEPDADDDRSGKITPRDGQTVVYQRVQLGQEMLMEIHFSQTSLRRSGWLIIIISALRIAICRKQQ